MSLEWMDGADHYGDDEELLTQGVYAEVGSTTLSTLNPRTGARHFRITAGNNGGLRRVFGNVRGTIGVGYAFYIPSLPTNSNSLCLAQIRDNGNLPVMSLGVSTTGQIVAWDGPNSSSFGIIRGASAPVILARSYQHFEARMSNNTVEVRLNGVTVLSVSGTFAGGNQSPAPTQFAQVQIGAPGLAITGFPPYFDVDDLFCWNALGSTNNDFIGDKKVYTRLPVSDSAMSGEDDWPTNVGGDKWEVLDNVPPNDESFIEAAAPGPVQVCGIGDFPSQIVAVAGVMVVTRAWKADAGNAKISVGVISGGSVETGDDHPLSMAPTYYHDPFDIDPETDAAWTVNGLNGIETRLERTE